MHLAAGFDLPLDLLGSLQRSNFPRHPSCSAALWERGGERLWKGGNGIGKGKGP